MITPLKTVEALRTYIQEITGKVFTDKELIWLNCMYQARSTFDCYSTKDMANVFLEGITPQNQLSNVQDLLDMIYQDLEITTDTTLYLQQFVAKHVGNHELANQIEGQIEEYLVNH